MVAIPIGFSSSLPATSPVVESLVSNTEIVSTSEDEEVASIVGNNEIDDSDTISTVMDMDTDIFMLDEEGESTNHHLLDNHADTDVENDLIHNSSSSRNSLTSNEDYIMGIVPQENDILKLELVKNNDVPMNSSASVSATSSSLCNRCGQEFITNKSTSSIAPPSVYKDVVVIGNGPSGIALSYFLAGNWPYYNGDGESVNEMLHYRLLAAGKQQQNNSTKSSSSPARNIHDSTNQQDEKEQSSSIVEQDLRFLAQGLEGRSTNPVALLFDTLNHPDADLGLELPSLLNWKKNSKHAIDHVIIGKGPPGGAWQLMDGNVLTISLGCWMELPQMNFRDWQTAQEARCPGRGESRASVASVAQYYCDYVQKHELEQYFVSNSEITEVTRIPCSQAADLPLLINENLPEDLLEAMTEGEENGNHHNFRKVRRHTISEIPVKGQNERELRMRNRSLWHVRGFTRDLRDGGKRQEFSYLTKSLVLATGSSDSPNVLNVPGESLDYVLHSLKHLEQLILSGQLNQHSDPILVVGAGLSAADAIIAARFHSIPVIHVFRRSVGDKNLIFKQLPENMYPEYHKVYQMMQDPTSYDGYKAYEQYVVAEIRTDKRVRLMGPLSSAVVKVSNILVCIGSHPDLSFLSGVEKNIGVHPGLPIDCKRNPIAIDFTTHESVREPGLFALGPLVGENFVRFLQGGALAITNHLTQSKSPSSC